MLELWHLHFLPSLYRPSHGDDFNGYFCLFQMDARSGQILSPRLVNLNSTRGRPYGLRFLWRLIRLCVSLNISSACVARWYLLKGVALVLLLPASDRREIVCMLLNKFLILVLMGSDVWTETSRIAVLLRYFSEPEAIVSPDGIAHLAPSSFDLKLASFN